MRSMRAFLTFAAVLVASTAAQVVSSSVVWYQCPLITISKKDVVTKDNPLVECADIPVPLCYDFVCNSTKTITVFVKRIPAQRASSSSSSSSAKAQALWMLQGGPGESSVNMEMLMVQAYVGMNKSVSVYTMDHRGTGRSTLLDCAEDNYPYNPMRTTACLAKIKSAFGNVAPAAFSVTSAAGDLKYVIDNVLKSTESYVYGLSYGTYLVERLMHLAPLNARGYVLDSIQSEQFYKTKDAPYYSNWDRDVADTVGTFLEYCDKDTFCSSRVGPNSKAYLKGLYSNLDKPGNKCADVIRQQLPEYASKPSWVVSNFLYSILKDYNKRNLIPAMMYRLNRCNTADQTVVSNMVNIMKNVTGDSMLLMTDLDNSASSGRVSTLNGDGRSTVVYKNIVLSEIWELPTPSMEQMAKWFDEALMGAMNPLDQKQSLMDNCIYLGGNDPICKNFSIPFNTSFVYARDPKFWNKTAPIPTGTSVLMFTGFLDPATPPKYARDEFATMQGTDKKLLEFAYSPHVVLGQTPSPAGDCGFLILSSYVANRGDLNKLPEDCIPKVYKLNFTTVLDNDAVASLFGTSADFYGPGAPGPNPSGAVPAVTVSPAAAASEAPRGLISVAVCVVAAVLALV